MAFENTVPDWQETGADIPESKLTTGWQEGEKPPANWFNRLFYSVSQAIKELQSKAAEVDYVDNYVEALNTAKINKASITDETGVSSTLVMSQKGATDAVEAMKSSCLTGIENKIDKSSLVDTTGISSTLVMSQKGVTDGLDLKIDKASIVSKTGTSASLVATQKLVTDLNTAQTTALTNGLAGKIDKASIVSETGTGTDTVMSQAGVTNAISSKVNKSDIEQTVSDSSSKVPSSMAVQNYVAEKIPNISYGTVLPSSGNEGDIFILY